MKIFFLVSFIFGSAVFNFSQNIPCKVDEKTLLFSGSPKEQAKCLLRLVKPRGILGETLTSLPKPLDNILGAKVKIKKENLRRFLSANHISEDAVGGSLNKQLSIAILPDGEKVQANYFLIHDTSTPNYLEKMFPVDINDASWRGNDLSVWNNRQIAHVFVSRLGGSVAPVSFSETLPDKSYGTKFARDVLKATAKGLEIHVELIQPRRSSANWFDGNDEIAPEIGFTDAQYKRLALLYICASVRRGTWLIPAFHAAVDAGIKDAHDDPQNFELEKFAAELKNLIEEIR